MLLWPPDKEDAGTQRKCLQEGQSWPGTGWSLGKGMVSEISWEHSRYGHQDALACCAITDVGSWGPVSKAPSIDFGQPVALCTTHMHACTHAHMQSLRLCGLYRKRKVLRTLPLISASTNRYRELSTAL